LGLNDFSPQSQDKAAVYLAINRLKGAGINVKNEKELEALLAKEGMSPRILNALAGEWASLPKHNGRSAYGQPVKNRQALNEVFMKNAKGGMSKPAAGGIGVGSSMMAMNDIMMDAMKGSAQKPAKTSSSQMADASTATPEDAKISFLDKDSRNLELFKAKDWRRKESIQSKSQELAKKDEKPQPVVVMKSDKKQAREKVNIPRQASMVPNPSAQKTVLDYHVYFNTRNA
jgi:hypothetical protein